MKNILLLSAAALLASCAVSPGTGGTSPRPAASAVKPAHCTSYQAMCLTQCATLNIPNPGACPVECPPSTDGTHQICAPSAACTLQADAARTHEYHRCLASCALEPFECL
jgi:hypothetical protein